MTHARLIAIENRMALLEHAGKSTGVDCISNETVSELIAEVRQLQEAYTLLRQKFEDRGEALVIANEQVKQAKHERLEAEIAARLVDDAYWRRVEWMAGQLVSGYATRDILIGSQSTVKEARDLVDEIDRQRAEEGGEIR